jgi:hypothetical protein
MYLQAITEYVVSYGNVGDFGRFRPEYPVRCHRGEATVIQTHRGLEVGTVLCAAQSGHARFLPNSSVGKLVRKATDADQASVREMQERARLVFAESRRLAAELTLPIEILDAEVLLDGKQAILHYLRLAECDERPLVSTLVKAQGLFVAMHSLAIATSTESEEPQGCDDPNCGGGGCHSDGGGHCSTCAIADLFRHSNKRGLN